MLIEMPLPHSYNKSELEILKFTRLEFQKKGLTISQNILAFNLEASFTQRIKDLEWQGFLFK